VVVRHDRVKLEVAVVHAARDYNLVLTVYLLGGDPAHVGALAVHDLGRRLGGHQADELAVLGGQRLEQAIEQGGLGVAHRDAERAFGVVVLLVEVHGCSVASGTMAFTAFAGLPLAGCQLLSNRRELRERYLQVPFYPAAERFNDATLNRTQRARPDVRDVVFDVKVNPHEDGVREPEPVPADQFAIIPRKPGFKCVAILRDWRIVKASKCNWTGGV
jgi:hypothetical protein